MKTLTLGSLFDGIGGFPLAAQRCGIKTLWASEIEPACIEITKRHFPKMEHLGDITQIDGGKIPPVDIISFGSPCQDLSSAGKQKGLSGERSGLFLDAIRIIYEMRRATNGRYPTFVVWENVSGAFSSNKGKDFRIVLEKITNADIPMPVSGKWATAGMVRGCRGGANAAWRLLDSQYWGVPQRRKRIFLVGDFRAERAPQILFELESVLGYTETRGKKRKGITPAFVGDLEVKGGFNGNSCIADFGRTADRIYYNADKSRTLTATTGGGGSATGNYLDISEVRPINLQVATRCKALGERTGLGIGKDGDPANTLQEQHSHGVFAAIAYDESQITFTTNRSNPKINDPCHSIGATNAGRAIVIRAAEIYPIRDPQLNRDSNGFVVGSEGDPAPTISAMERHAIAACFAPGGFGDYKEGVGTLRASAGKHGISSANIVVAGEAAGFVNTTGKTVTGTLDSNYYKGTGARSGVEREVVGVIKPDYIQKNVGDLNELVTCYAPSSYGTYKEGFGPLRQTGFGDSENLIVIFKKIAYWIKYELRKLTPLECERLQGFPDYWTKYGESGAELPDTPRYKALGNSLTVPCAERVFRGIIAVISGNVIKKDSEV